MLRRVLLVDDEPDIRTIAELSLATIGGLEVEPATDGHDAVRRVGASRPDLVLLDVMMPGLDGPATFAALRAVPGCADLPIVFMTAKAQKREVRALLELGAIGVVTKPFDPMTLADDVRRIYDAALNP